MYYNGDVSKVLDAEIILMREVGFMKHIITLNSRDIKKSVKDGGCGECQTSCQSACKTSCGIANQSCEKKK